MTHDDRDGVTTQVHRVYIKATPRGDLGRDHEPEWTAKYGYRRSPSTT